MKGHRTILAGICVSAGITLLAAAAWAYQAVTIAAILESPSWYDGKEVRVCAQAYHVKQKTSKAGNPYTSFRIKEEESRRTLGVYFRGTAPIRDNQNVCVTGVFNITKKVGEYTFENQIEATEVR